MQRAIAYEMHKLSDKSAQNDNEWQSLEMDKEAIDALETEQELPAMTSAML